MLVFSPLVLIIIGLLAARVSKARRVWRRHGLFTTRFGIVVLALYTALSLGIFLGVPSFAPLTDALSGEDPTAWFVGSGLFAEDVRWPVEDAAVMAIVVVSFMLYPFWYWLGVNAGFWLFGRSPKQTGILGLLR